jgi:hypothetical protein
MYLLGAIVLLLIVLVAVVYSRQQPVPVASSPSGTESVAATGTSMPGVKPSTGGFDKATATKVPTGQDPKTFVSAYYQAILDKKYDVAFKMQPAASQQGGTVQDFQGTQQMYGMKAFKILDSQVQATDATVQVEQDLGTNGTWGATWTFVKDGSTWLVKERQVQMGVAQ